MITALQPGRALAMAAAGPGEGTCVIDEPEGNNPDTYGGLTYRRTTSGDEDRIVFDIDLQDPDGAEPPTLTGLQICVQPADNRDTNPHTPARANSCAGASPDRVYVDEDAPIEEPVTIDLVETLGDDFTPGETIFFAVHMTIDDGGESRTVMVTGPVGAATGAATQRLVVSKDVVGGQGGERFTFMVDCGDYSLSGRNHDGATFENGDATLTLGDGDEATFGSIPRGTTCTIGEQVPTGQWTTSVNGDPDADRAVEVALDQDRTVAFTNQAATSPGGDGGQLPGGPQTPADGDTTTTTVGGTSVGGAAAEQPAAGSEQSSQQPAQETESPTQVAGAQEQRDTTLPRTGIPAATFVALAAGLVAAGTALRVAGGRSARRAEDPAR